MRQEEPLYVFSAAMVFATGDQKKVKNYSRLLQTVVDTDGNIAHGDDDALVDSATLYNLISKHGAQDVKIALLMHARVAVDATVDEDETEESLRENLSENASRAPLRLATLVADIAKKYPGFKEVMLAKLQGTPTKPLAEVQDSKARRRRLWSHLWTEFSPKGDLDAMVAGFAKLFGGIPGLLHMIVQHPLSEASRLDICQTFVRALVTPAMRKFSACVRGEVSAVAYRRLQTAWGMCGGTVLMETGVNPFPIGERAAADALAQIHSDLPEIGDVRTFLGVRKHFTIFR
jgi:hypothetical protein